MNDQIPAPGAKVELSEDDIDTALGDHDAALNNEQRRNVHAAIRALLAALAAQPVILNGLTSSPAEGDDAEREPAPLNDLPSWAECDLIIANHEFRQRAAAGLEGQVLDLPPVTPPPTALHRFIHEYDDADPYRSDWFMHRLELVVKEAAPANVQPKGTPAEWTEEQIEAVWGRYDQGYDTRRALIGRILAATQAPAPAPSLLHKLRAHIVWQSFGECRSPGWDGPPPSAREAVDAIDSALAAQAPAVEAAQFTVIAEVLQSFKEVGSFKAHEDTYADGWTDARNEIEWALAEALGAPLSKPPVQPTGGE